MKKTTRTIVSPKLGFKRRVYEDSIGQEYIQIRLCWGMVDEIVANLNNQLKEGETICYYKED